MHILFFLFIYQNTYKIPAPNYTYTIPLLIYGFKKNAQVNIQITDLQTPIVYGLATTKEIKHVNSLGNCSQYCDNLEKFFTIQQFFTTNTSISFTIPKKSVLTPIFISCVQIYSFNIELHIVNGKNQLDYRFQDIMICLLVFCVIYFVISVIYIVHFIFLIKNKQEKKNQFIFIFIFIFLSAILMLILYLEYFSSRKEEYITLSKGYEIGINFLSLMILYDLIIFNFWNDSTNYIRKKFHVFWQYMIVNIISMVLLLTTFFVGMFVTNISVHFTCYILFFLCTLATSSTPSYFSLTKVTIIVYMCSNFATFAKRYPLLSGVATIQPVGTAIWSLDIISIVFTSITIFFLSLDYFYLNDNFYDISNIDKPDKRYKTNYDDEFQRNQIFLGIQGGLKNDKSYDIFYKD